MAVSQLSERPTRSSSDVSNKTAGRARPRVEELNQFIVCGLCDGYLIDATTVAHCLHSCMFSLYSFFHHTRFELHLSYIPSSNCVTMCHLVRFLPRDAL